MVLPLSNGPLELEVRVTFRVVGVELGSVKRVATSFHVDKRIPCLAQWQTFGRIGCPDAISCSPVALHHLAAGPLRV